jgi:glycosyltransferase involved in cell wall biosynthesis
MKIAFVSDHASPLAARSDGARGQTSYVAEVARELVLLGHTVDVFTRCDRPLLPMFAGMEGARIIYVPAGPPIGLPSEQLLPHMREFADFLIDFFQQEAMPYDVLHANGYTSGLAAQWVKEALGIPLVMSFHAPVRQNTSCPDAGHDSAGTRDEIEEALVWQADSIVVDCPDAEAGLCARYGAEPSRIAIVPRGYDADQAAPVDRETARGLLGWPRTRFAVLHAGPLLPGDGVDTIVRSIGVLRDLHHQDAGLYIVGSGMGTPGQAAAHEAARLHGIVRECGLADRVTFVGRCARTELNLFYSAADVFVTAGRCEPFDVMPLEAMARQTPVVGADFGEIRQSVRHGETGFLVPPQDPVALAGRLAALKADPALARRLGAAGQVRARAQFTWPGTARSLADVYGRVARRTQPVRAADSRTNSRVKGRRTDASSHAIGS